MRSLMRRLRNLWPLWVLCIVTALPGIVRAQVTPLAESDGGFTDDSTHFGQIITTAGVIRADLNTALLHQQLAEINPWHRPAKIGPFTILGSDYWQSFSLYLLHALVQALVPSLSLVDRWYLARYTNVVLGMALTAAAYFVTTRATEDKRLSLAIAGVVGLTPSISYGFATVTTDSTSVLVSVLLFGAAVWLCRRGGSIWVALGLLAGTWLCLTTKITSWVTIVLVGVMIVRRSLPLRWVLLLGAAAAVGAAIVVSRQLSPAGAAHWYVYSFPRVSDIALASTDNTQAMVGRRSLVLRDVGDLNPVIQYLSDGSLSAARGQTATIGSWVRAPAGTRIALPAFQQFSNRNNQTIGDLLDSAAHTVTATGEWQFAQYTTTIHSQATLWRLALWQPEGYANPVWYDGLIVALNEYPANDPPRFLDNAASRGTWGGQPFANLLQNGSAEAEWLGTESPELFLGYPPNQRLFAIQDFSRTWRGYVDAGRTTFSTLWGAFKGDYPGLMRWHYGVILVCLAVGAVGWVKYGALFLRHGYRSPVPYWAIEAWVLWLLLDAAMALLRADVSASWASMSFYAAGRFVFPVIYPSVCLAITGWGSLLPRRWLLIASAAALAAMTLLNIWMLTNVELTYYTCPGANRWDCVPLN